MSKMRLVGVAALMVLVLGVFAGAALAQATPVAGPAWNVTSENIPDSMVWDQSLAASISVENNSTNTNWGLNTSIVSVDQPTSAALAVVDRWGPSQIDIAGPVARSRWTTDGLTLRLAGTYTWDFGISAPPIASMAYATPVGPTTAPMAVPFANKWVLAFDGDPVDNANTVPAGGDCFIYRFPDLGTAPQNVNAGYVQELAGRVPMIVQGFPDGTYRPTVSVNRGTMAAYIQRAMQLPLGTYAGEFPDVASDNPNAGAIQALVDAGIVGGYGDGTYRPTVAVNRGNMAIFVARGLAGGDAYVPTPAPVATFPDVPTTFQPWKYVEYCVDAGVVQGFPDGNYRPTQAVARGTMAVYVYRAFIRPTPSIVVLAGPAVTDVDTSTALMDGWSTVVTAPSGAPVTAYVGLDLFRLGDADVDVDFALMDGATVVASGTDPITGIPAKKTAAALTGNPYVYAKWAIPAVADGAYTLVVSVDGQELLRQPAFVVAPAAPPVLPTEVVLYPTEDDTTTGGGTLSSGTFADLAAADGTCEVVASDSGAGTGGAQWITACTIAPADMLKMKMELTMALSANNAAFSLMASGKNGNSRYLASFGDFVPDTMQTVTYETANTSKFTDLFFWNNSPLTGEFYTLSCGCADGMAGGAYNISFDQMKSTFTLRP